MRPARAPALVAAAALLLAAACGSERGSPDDELAFPRAPVLLVSIDTLRADRLGTYGSTRGASPRLDALAHESVVFEDVYATSCKTAESHMSLFTSLPVTVHGVSNASPRLGIPLTPLCDNRMTLGQMLRRAGYWNAAVACGGNVVPEMGFSRGFEGRFDSRLRDVSEIVDATLAQIDAARSQDQPWFVFAHTYQVHAPYVPPPDYRRRFAPDYRGVVGERVRAIEGRPFIEQWAAMNSGFWEGKEQFGADDADYLSDLYDGEVAYTDAQIGRLLDGLGERGLLDRMIVIVLSDHGEEFAEHGEFEHDQLFRESLHVPLLVRLPGGRLAGTRVAGLASLLDVLPTLLELLGVQSEAALAGQSLVPAMRSGHTRDLPVLSERTMFADAYQAALRTPDTAVQFRARDGRLLHFDLAADPAEAQALDPPPAPAVQVATELKARLGGLFALRASLDAHCSVKAVELDAASRAEIEQLGYTGGAGESEPPAGTPLERWPDAAR